MLSVLVTLVSRMMLISLPAVLSVYVTAVPPTFTLSTVGSPNVAGTVIATLSTPVAGPLIVASMAYVNSLPVELVGTSFGAISAVAGRDLGRGRGNGWSADGDLLGLVVDGGDETVVLDLELEAIRR